MQIIEKIKQDIIRSIKKILDERQILPEEIVYPPSKDMGDLSLPLFKLLKAGKKNPKELASRIIAGFKSDYISSISSQGPYLNFIVDKDYLSRRVIQAIKKEEKEYGHVRPKNKKNTMVEYSNVNTHKEYHLGHLRNLFFGDSVAKILGANGGSAIPVSYVNDFGIHTAKTLWAYNEYYKDKKIKEGKGEFLGRVYARAAVESQKNQLARGIIKGIMKKIESRKGPEYELWQKTREWSVEQFNKIYKELGINFVRFYYESEFIDKGKRMIPRLIEKGILEKSQGAVIANLEKYQLGVLVVLRSDGTATYPVADIPLAMEKFREFNIKRSIYVVDKAQTLYFKQLFKILEMIGLKGEKLHLAYDIVKLPEGKMSSRLGNAVTYSELKKKILEVAEKETAKRHDDWPEERIKEVSWKIARGAMKFEMLKVGPGQPITFDVKKSLSFQGYTAVYLQYTFARIKSIIRRSAAEKAGKINYAELAEAKEHQILWQLAKYPETVKEAGEKYSPSEIAKYLFDLCRMFNDYYHQIPVLKAEKETKKARLQLITSVSQVIENGLGLLGIDVIEKM